MGVEWQGVARALIVFGLALAGGGVLLLLAPKLPWIGRLPGDLLIRRLGVTFYFPLTSCIVASLVVSVVWWLISRFR